VDSIKKLASAKISEASIKQLEPMIKRKGNLDQYYSMSDLKAELHYLVTTELDEHIVGQLMARIRGKQVSGVL
jgi:hypothetical protein